LVALRRGYSASLAERNLSPSPAERGRVTPTGTHFHTTGSTPPGRSTTRRRAKFRLTCVQSTS